MRGAEGGGGLLGIEASGTEHFVAYDGSGNVSGLGASDRSGKKEKTWAIDNGRSARRGLRSCDESSRDPKERRKRSG